MWPLFAIAATQIIHLQVGFNLQVLLWSGLLALVATALAIDAAGLDSPEDALIPGCFTSAAQQSLGIAREEAAHYHHDFIGTEHVLLGLLQPEHGIVRNVLRKLGVGREIVRAEIEKQVGRGPVHPARRSLPFTPRVRRACRLAAREARALNHSVISAEHIFLGLILEDTGVAALVLKRLNVNAAQAREEILNELDPHRSRD